jgi:hypothetical protein
MIFLFLASLTQPFTRSEQADLLELNHHYDTQRLPRLRPVNCLATKPRHLSI